MSVLLAWAGWDCAVSSSHRDLTVGEATAEQADLEAAVAVSVQQQGYLCRDGAQGEVCAAGGRY